jgi:hypothetical protein
VGRVANHNNGFHSRFPPRAPFSLIKYDKKQGARQGAAGLGVARQGMARHGRARLGRARFKTKTINRGELNDTQRFFRFSGWLAQTVFDSWKKQSVAE